jgi:N-succinyl-L-ornithine transcarbamylase
MSVTLHHFTSLADVPEPLALLDLARALKTNPHAYRAHGTHRALGMLFRNPSLRTRLSTQRAAQLLGMDSMTLDLNGDAWPWELHDGVPMDGPTSEHIREAAPVLGQYCDVLALRDFPLLQNREADEAELLLNSLKALSGVPVISLESTSGHPLQSLTDWMTIEELKPRKCPRVLLTWAPHPRALPHAVPHSFLAWMRQAEVELVVAHPPGYALRPDLMAGLEVHHNPEAGYAGADFVYAKNWSTYQPEYGQHLPVDDAERWIVDGRKMALTAQARFMHCLPARREVYIRSEVLNSPASVVVQQAGNRVWAAMAVLLALLQTCYGTR